MRILTIISGALIIISALYKWRYRIINIFLAFRVLRKMFVFITMKMPKLRSKFMPVLFQESK